MDNPVRKAVIPAAGRGTRFLPVTKAVPKELLPIVSTPALDLVVTEAAAHGLADVLLVVSAGKQSVVEYFRPDPDLEAAVAKKPALLESVRRATSLANIHEVEQQTPRGLGDAVGRAEQFAAGEPVVVMLPDDLVDDRDDLLGPMLDVYARHGGIVLALVDVGRKDIDKYGCVAVDEPEGDIVTVTDMVEKPPADEAPSTLAIIGRYVLPPEIFPAIRATTPGAGGEIQLTDAMKALLDGGVPVHGVVFRGRRYDTGDRLDYLRAVVQLATRHPDLGADFLAWLREYVANMPEGDATS